jgi:DNA-directed RNA polymerase alpha subunit
VKNFGKTTLREVEKRLEELDLTLGMDVDAILKG